MVKFSARLVILAALILIVGAVQCASACTPVLNAQPPCHHHKKAAADPCPQEMVAASVAQHDVALMPVGAVVTFDQAVALVPGFAPSSDPSPPPISVPLILRV